MGRPPYWRHVTQHFRLTISVQNVHIQLGLNADGESIARYWNNRDVTSLIYRFIKPHAVVFGNKSGPCFSLITVITKASDNLSNYLSCYLAIICEMLSLYTSRGRINT
jgi:hypothetical protein